MLQVIPIDQWKLILKGNSQSNTITDMLPLLENHADLHQLTSKN